MSPRLRAAAIVAALGAGVLLLSAAVPSGSPAQFKLPSALSDPSSPSSPEGVLGSPPPGSVASQTAVNEWRALGEKAPALHLDSNGVVRTITAVPGQNLGTDADAFVRRYAGAFGLTKAHGVTRGASVDVPGGDKVVRFQQQAAGLPILGGEIVLTVAADGGVRSAITDTTSLAPVGGSARLDPAAARAKGIEAAIKAFELDAASLTGQASLWLYDASKNDPSLKPALRPTYWVKLLEGEHEVASVLVDAIDGSIKLTASEHQSAKKRVVCDRANTRVNLNSWANYECGRYSTLGQQATTRSEGEPASTVNDVNAAYAHLGVAYDYFNNTFGRDSFNGRGAQLMATVRICHTVGSCPEENAFWDGIQFAFGQGWATDDVVAHEFTHAVTEHASNLFYWHESGAINEALSDIFGQLIDLQTPADDAGIKRWEIGEDLPPGATHTGGAIRDMLNPHRFGQPAYYQESGYWFFNYDWSNWDNGGVHRNSGVANRVAARIGDTIGLAKSAQLWYRVMHLLPSGSNHYGLGLTLMAACRELINHHGFTPADCGSVDQIAVDGQIRAYQAAPNPCGGSPKQIFFDDLESGTANWRFNNNHYWQLIPSPSIDYSYASSGRHSINGWSNRGSSVAHGTSIELVNAVDIPVGDGGPVYLRFNHSMINDPSAGQSNVKTYVDAGQGWIPLPMPPTYSSNDIGGRTNGYVTLATPSIGAYRGKSVRIKFEMNTPTGLLVDWYLDDIELFACEAVTPGKVPSKPEDAFAYREGTNLVVSWGAWTPVGHSDLYGYHYELTYSPDIPGAPTSVEPILSPSPGQRYWVTAPGMDPNQSYTVGIRIILEDGSNIVSPTAFASYDPSAPVTCPSSASQPLAPPMDGRRPMLGIPEGQCFRGGTPPIPRRIN